VAGDLFVLLGHPVSHSLSPAMHRAAFRALGISASYVALDATAFEPAWEAVRRLRIAGGNVTVPWKEAAAAALEAPSEDARRLRSANTFWLTPQGRIAGTETDGEGFLRALREEFGVTGAGLRAAVLGAGGGGRAVAGALARAGASMLYLWNRTPGKAERLAGLLAETGFRSGVEVLPSGPAPRELPGGAPVDLLVNATSLGLSAGDPSPADPVRFPGLRFAMDLVYGRVPSAFVRACRAAGARTADGRAMLLHQGACAFEIWFGRPAPLEAMRRALTDVLGQRI
jgi:shikimate dehydrogenase